MRRRSKLFKRFEPIRLNRVLHSAFDILNNILNSPCSFSGRVPVIPVVSFSVSRPVFASTGVTSVRSVQS